MVVAFVSSVLLTLASSAQAEPERISPADTISAVGRVNIAGHTTRSHCSGSLIAPDLVLTAAHCTAFGFGWAEPLDIRFVAGWDRGEHFGASRAIEVIRHPQAGGAMPAGYSAGTDLALLRLQDPIDIEPLRLSEPLAAFEIGALQGYAGDRPHVQTRIQNCTLANDVTVALYLNCLVVGGMSGAPLIQNDEIIGVVSASVLRDGQHVSLIGRIAPFIYEELEKAR